MLITYADINVVPALSISGAFRQVVGYGALKGTLHFPLPEKECVDEVEGLRGPRLYYKPLDGLPNHAIAWFAKPDKRQG